MSGPLRRWMGRHPEVQRAPAMMGQNHERVEELETDRRNHEKVCSHQALHVVLQKRAPGLGRRPSLAHHVLGNGGLGDVDAELQQFAVNPRRSLQRIGRAHGPNEIADLRRYRWAAICLATFPSPVEPKSFAVPGNDGLRLHEDEGRSPVLPNPGQAEPKEAILGTKAWSMAERCRTSSWWRSARVSAWSAARRRTKFFRADSKETRSTVMGWKPTGDSV